MARNIRKKPKQAAAAGTGTAQGKARPPVRSRWGDWTIPALLFVLTLLAHAPAFFGAFVWDDEDSVMNNPLLRGLGGLLRIWTTTGRIPEEIHWWPLTYTVLWGEYQFWGLNALGYHAVNVLLAAGIVVLLWRVLKRAGVPGAGIAAALFAVHPVHAEAIAWVTSLKDLLSAGFYLVAVDFFLSYVERGKNGWLIGATLAAVAGMLSKSMGVTLPVGILILVWWMRGRVERRVWAGLIPIGVVVLVFALVDVWVAGHAPNPLDLQAPPALERVTQAGWALWMYWGKLVWPVRLSVIYPQWGMAPGNAARWLPLVCAIAVTVVLWSMRGRIGRGALACWLFYGVTLGPVLGLVYFSFLSDTPIADRYQYLASAGPLVGMGALAAGWMNARAAARRWVWKIMFGLLLGILGVLTWRQCGLYRGQVLLFEHALELGPTGTAYINLGVGYSKEGHWKEAAEALRKARELVPRDGIVDYNLGMAEYQLGQQAEAVAAMRGAVALEPSNADFVAGLAWILVATKDARLRQPAEAVKLVRQAIALSPIAPGAYYDTLGIALSLTGQWNDAVAAEQQAIALAQAQGDKVLERNAEQHLELMRSVAGPKGAGH